MPGPEVPVTDVGPFFGSQPPAREVDRGKY